MPFNFDKSAFEAKLPPAGRQAATIIDVNVHEGEDATWLNVKFGLDSGHQIEQMVTVDAQESSPFLPRVPEGLGFVQKMCEATSTDISKLREPEDLMGAFIGVRVDVVVTLRTQAGMKRPVIKAVLPHDAKAPATAG